MIFRCTKIILGKWKGWDHIKGRNKSRGAIHIRHTLGSKGRYPRLHGNFSIRDGRRHPGNRTQGGLGIKLGGGLFGMRVPRQHALSTMSQEEYDVEVHGHPNITNPYRYCLEEHPSLDKVRSVPLMKLTVVVALPHFPLGAARRYHSSSPIVKCPEGTTLLGRSPPPEAVTLPYWWESAIPEVCKWLQCAGVWVQTDVMLATNHASVMLPGSSTLSMSQAVTPVLPARSSSSPADGIHAALAALYTATLSRRRTATPRPPIDRGGSVSHALIDGALLAVNSSLPNAKKLFSAPLSGDSLLSRRSSPSNESSDTASALSCSGDIRSCLTSLQDRRPNALKLRTVLPLVHTTAPGAEAYVPHGDAKHAVESVNDVLKWYVYHQDPRSHFNDLVAHAERQLHVRVLVECEKPVRATEDEEVVGDTSARRRSVVTPALNALLEKQGFRRTAETAREVIPQLQQWSVLSNGVTAKVDTQVTN